MQLVSARNHWSAYPTALGLAAPSVDDPADWYAVTPPTTTAALSTAPTTAAMAMLIKIALQSFHTCFSRLGV